MPLPLPTSHHLRTARGLMAGAVASVDHVIAGSTPESVAGRLELQAEWMIGELQHAICQIRNAARAAGVQADEAEALPAESYVPAIGIAA